MNDTNVGVGMYYDSPDEKEIARLNARLKEAQAEIAKLRAEGEAAAAYVSVIPISAGLTPQTAEQYNAYIPYLTARTKGD